MIKYPTYEQPISYVKTERGGIKHYIRITRNIKARNLFDVERGVINPDHPEKNKSLVTKEQDKRYVEFSIALALNAGYTEAR
jgi:hypothetical protein